MCGGGRLGGYGGGGGFEEGGVVVAYGVCLLGGGSGCRVLAAEMAGGVERFESSRGGALEKPCFHLLRGIGT